LEAGDLEVAGGDLLVELLFPCAGGVEFLTGGQGVAVDGGDEPVGDGVDGFIDVQVGAQEDFGSLRGYWGKLLFGFVGGSCYCQDGNPT